MRRSTSTRIAVVALSLAALVGGSALAVAHTPNQDTVPPSDRVCFSARSWSADDGERPCARVTRIYEDGSVELQVLDANGTERYREGIGVPND